jgi:hypothetical protein
VPVGRTDLSSRVAREFSRSVLFGERWETDWLASKGRSTKLPVATQLLSVASGPPTAVMTAAGMTPDPWQEQVLVSNANQMLLLCGRQMGKYSVSASLALSTAMLKDTSPVLLLSPSDRQSGELFRKMVELYDAVGWQSLVRFVPGIVA